MALLMALLAVLKKGCFWHYQWYFWWHNKEKKDFGIFVGVIRGVEQKGYQCLHNEILSSSFALVLALIVVLALVLAAFVSSHNFVAAIFGFS